MLPSLKDCLLLSRCPGKMADDIDIEAMLEAPYKKVRKHTNKVFSNIHLALFMKLLLNCKLTSLEPS